LAVLGIKWFTAIFDLDDVVGKHAVLWVAPGASLAVLDGFASGPGSIDDLGPPLSELWRGIERIGPLEPLLR
jgi:hypothetical protein